jgi:hypothetical protein
MADKQVTKWTDEEVISLLSGDMSKAESIQQELSEQRAENYSRFRMEPYGNEREGFSQTVAPVVYNNHKWTMANLMEIFNEDFFVLKGEDEERTAKFQKLIYYQMFRKQDGFKRYHDFLFNAELYHYGIFKTYYKEDFDLEYETYARLSPEEMMQIAQEPNVTISKYDEVTDEMGGTAYEKVKVVKKKIHYAGPCFDVVPNWELFYSPDCKITDWGAIEGRLVYHKTRKTLNDVRKREKAGIYKKGTFEKIKDSFDPITPDSQDKTEILFNIDSVSTQDTQEPSNKEESLLSREVEIVECYYKLDIDGDGLLEPVIIDICGDTVCRLVENEYMRPPFRLGHIYPEPHKVTGMTMPQLLDNDQKISTNLLRLIQDSAALDCYKNPVTNDQQMFTMLQTRKPFAVIKGDPARLGEVKTSPPSSFVLQAYELLKEENEAKTGLTRYNQGQDAASLNKTATGISAIMGASGKPLRLIARILGNTILGVIRDFVFINQKWPPTEAMRLLGTDVTVNPQDLDGAYEIEIDIGVSPDEKNSMANQIDLLIQFATQAGLQMGIMSPIHVLKAEKKKYKVLGIKVDDLMFSEQEFAKNQEQQKQQPPKPPDLKEYVQLDKLFPLLTPMEQAQILEKFGIQHDPKREQMAPTALSGQEGPDGGPVPQQDPRMEMARQQAEAQQQMAMSQQQHVQGLRHKEDAHQQALRHKQAAAALQSQSGPPSR